LKRAKESTRKKQEWYKLKTSKKFDDKEKEITTLKEQLTEKDKEIKLSELKLKELYAFQKGLMSEEIYNEVGEVISQQSDKFSSNYMRLRELGDRMMVSRNK
jgi:hypothetical protein